MYPRITADLGKLRYNARFIADACHAAGIHYAAVTKGVCASPPIVEALEDIADSFADSRLLNLMSMRTRKPKLMLRIGDPAQAEQLIAAADLSLQSELVTLQALARAAQAMQRPHKVVLMVDLGDLREGLMYTDRSAILAAARLIKESSPLELHGLGTNLTCFGGILPDEENLARLTDIARWLRRELDLPIPLVSGGNSSSIGLMLRGGMPRGINHLRIGEAALLNNNTAIGEPFDFLHQDVFTLSAVLGEVQQKPSQPFGNTGPNAFGEYVSFPDLGPMRRGILLLGRQDADIEGLRPRDPRVKVLGASSDHLLVDLTAAPEYAVGDALHFSVSYGCMLKAYTSPYVSKAYTPA